MNNSKTILRSKGLTVGYSSKGQEKEVLHDLNLELRTGELTCLLGPNGSGKSTLMRTLAGIQKPLNGEIELEHLALGSIGSKEMARKLSLVLTDKTTPGNLTAYALVSLGRFPYSSWMGTLTREDKVQIQWAMRATGCEDFANIHIGELSDGEKQKVMIARALAQDTPMIFLDEPTAHLDLPNRIDIFHLLRELALESKKAILLTSHEMDMALANSSRLWLVNPDQTVSTGIPEDLVLNGRLEKAFVRDTVTFDYEDGNFKRATQTNGRTAFVIGPNPLTKWTKKALERQGFDIKPESEAQLKICIEGNLQEAEWHLGEEKTTYRTIEQLLKAIE